MGRNKWPAVYIYLPMLNHPFALWQWVIFPRCHCNSSAPQWLSQPTFPTHPDKRHLDGAPAFPGVIFWGFLRKVQVTHGTSSTTSPLRYLEAGCPLLPHIFCSKPMEDAEESYSEHRNPCTHPAKMVQTSANLGLHSGHSLVFCNCSSATRARTDSPSIRGNITIIRDLWHSLQCNWGCSLVQKLRHPGQSTSLLV